MVPESAVRVNLGEPPFPALVHSWPLDDGPGTAEVFACLPGIEVRPGLTLERERGADGFAISPSRDETFCRALLLTRFPRKASGSFPASPRIRPCGCSMTSWSAQSRRRSIHSSPRGSARMSDLPDNELGAYLMTATEELNLAPDGNVLPGYRCLLGGR